MEREIVTLSDGTKAEVLILCLCEQDNIVLKPNRLYRFVVVDDCPNCVAISKMYQNFK